MNIFALHKSPRIAARWHVDKHVVRMSLETTQLLTNAYYVMLENKFGGERTGGVEYLGEVLNMKYPDFPRERFYKLTHRNHPSTNWASTCKENWEWLLRLGKELCREYQYRYNRQHACAPLLQWMTENHPVLPDSSSSQTTPFPLIMPKRFQVAFEPIKSYRIYYTFGKKDLHSWTKREPPFFINSYRSLYRDVV